MIPDLESPPLPRSPWQRFYGSVLARRRRRGGGDHLPGITWSIGNLHWGGGGKTPLVAEIGRQLIELGASVCVLSRGYGRKGHEPTLVSRGDGPVASAFDSGDEPHLLARTVPGLAVAVAPRRVDAGRLALRELDDAPEVFLLDDGFSHVRLARQLDLLAFPASDPFAGGRLLPSGRLREPLSSTRWSQAAVLTGLAPDASAEELETQATGLAAALAPHGFDGRAFAARLETELHGATTRDEVILVSGVARPEAVLSTAQAAGVEVKEHLSFADHHPYPESSLRRIAEALDRHPGAKLLATSKDWGKLTGRLDRAIAELSIRTVVSQGFAEWIGERLAHSRQIVADGAPPPR